MNNIRQSLVKERFPLPPSKTPEVFNLTSMKSFLRKSDVSSSTPFPSGQGLKRQIKIGWIPPGRLQTGRTYAPEQLATEQSEGLPLEQPHSRKIRFSVIAILFIWRKVRSKLVIRF